MTNSDNDKDIGRLNAAFSEALRATTESWAAQFAAINDAVTAQLVSLARIPVLPPELLETLKGIEETVRRDFEGAARLGQFGWTIPLNATLPECRSLTEAATDIASADAAFAKYYEADAGSRVAELWDAVMKVPAVAPSLPLLAESRWVFDQGRYRVCVLALLTVLDGVGHRWHEEFFKGSRRKSLFKEKLRAEPGTATHSIWRSVSSFAEIVFKSQFESSGFNRNWLIHGRGIPDDSPLDCLRVLQAILTFADLD